MTLTLHFIPRYSLTLTETTGEFHLKHESVLISGGAHLVVRWIASEAVGFGWCPCTLEPAEMAACGDGS